jgi:predicted phosphoadenosine phosphosulfate sulfurtransferase
VSTWEYRCYKDGIPDEIPSGLMRSMRVPSYKALAVSILKNDFNLLSVGFSRKETELSNELLEADRVENNPNMRLF